MLASVRLVALALTLAGLFFSSSSVLAQDTSQILDRLMRLERDLAETQREVFRPSAKARTGSVMSTPLAGNRAAPRNTGEVPLIARHEIRLQQLENQLRKLTGRVEEFSFSINQFGKRLDRLVSDVDYRLQRLEAGLKRSGPNSQVPEVAARQRQISQSSAESSNEGRTGSPALGDNNGELLDKKGTRALGQISADTPPAKLANQIVATPQQILPTGTPRERYDFAFGLLRKQDYVAAESAFEAFIEQHPNDDLSGNAQYWLAETYYVREQFEQAAVAFAAGYQNYPENIKAADNLLKLALSLARIKKTQDACVALNQLAERFPKAPSNIRRRAVGEGRRLGCTS